MALSESTSEELNLEDLYAQLQAHLEAERWIEAIATCYRILHAQPNYRDVPQLLERARKQLAIEREQSRRAREMWRSTWAPMAERAQPQRGRWLLALLIGLGLCALSVVLALALPRLREQLPIMGAQPRVSATPSAIQTPWAPTATAGMQPYVSSEGHFFLKYPQDWMVKESPSEGRPLRIVILTPKAMDQPERLSIFFAPGSGQTPEQIWISILGFMQAVREEDVEDWRLGEATSTSIGGYHARQIPFHYRHVESEVEWRGLIVGVVYDSMNYAFVAEAPGVRWLWAWPIFEQILDSVQFQ